MKKLLLFTCAIFAAISAFAQDIVVLRDGTRIEARVFDYSDTQVKYKEYSNLRGPMIIAEAAELERVLFQSGKELTFGDAAPAPAPAAQPARAAQPAPATQPAPAAQPARAAQPAPAAQPARAAQPAPAAKSEVASQPASAAQPARAAQSNEEPVRVYIASEPASAAIEPLPSMMIEKEGKEYILGTQRMDKAQYLEFIEANCPEAYKSYKTGRALTITGLALFGSGALLAAWGGAVNITGLALFASGVWETPLPLSIPGTIIGWSGAGIVLASIPCVVIGEIKLHTSHKVYNESCANAASVASLEFGIQSSQNGIGLAMKF